MLDNDLKQTIHDFLEDSYSTSPLRKKLFGWVEEGSDPDSTTVGSSLLQTLGRQAQASGDHQLLSLVSAVSLSARPSSDPDYTIVPTSAVHALKEWFHANGG